jgi:phage shock protein PspC (stress-responsive transcriptional regulator)
MVKAKKRIKRLYRVSERDSMVGGVCAGIADYFSVDPTLIRLAWVLMTVFSFGTGVLGYFVMWIIMPRRN